MIKLNLSKDSDVEILKLKLKKMPFLMQIKVSLNLFFAGNNSKKQMKIMKDINKRRKFTIPREEIDWNPKVNEELCNSCGKCIKFCPTKVFISDIKTGKAIVKNPAKCVFLCNGCENKCDNKAIKFPEKRNYIKYIFFE